MLSVLVLKAEVIHLQQIELFADLIEEDSSGRLRLHLKQGDGVVQHLDANGHHLGTGAGGTNRGSRGRRGSAVVVVVIVVVIAVVMMMMMVVVTVVHGGSSSHTSSADRTFLPFKGH